MPSINPMPLGVSAVMLPELDFEEQVALCSELGVSYYVFRPRYLTDAQRQSPYHNHGNHKFDLTPERMVEEGPKFKQALESAGITPFYSVPRGTAADDDQTLRLHMQGAAAAGCSRLRLIPPPYPNQPFDFETYLGQARQRLAELVKMANAFGLKIVIEMHAGNSAASPGLARILVEEFHPDQLGLIVDLPNFVKEGAMNPNLAVSAMGHYIDHVHLGGHRKTTGQYDEAGFRKAGSEMCALTESDLYIPDWLEAIHAVKPDAVLVIEDFTTDRSGANRLRNNVEAVGRLMSRPGI